MLPEDENPEIDPGNQSYAKVQTAFTMVPHGILANSKIDNRAFRVYAMLRSYAFGRKQTAFPGLTRVAQEFNVSESTVKRGLADLKALGYIVVDKRRTYGGMRTSNLYYFPDIRNDGSTESSEPQEVNPDLSQ